MNVQRGRVKFTFRGKSGVEHEIDLDDRRLATDREGVPRPSGLRPLPVRTTRTACASTIGSADVNAYLKESPARTTRPRTSAPGPAPCSPRNSSASSSRSVRPEAKRNIVSAIEDVSKRLGNTKAVCRKCYMHPDVLDAYSDGSLLKVSKKSPRPPCSPC